MKKLFQILLSLLLLVILFAGTWLGVNLWPRTIELPLWTEADLATPKEKDSDGYPVLLAMKENPILTSEALEIPESVLPLTILQFPQTVSDLDLFWRKAKQLESTLSTFIRAKTPALQEYQKLLDAPRFIDQDPISVELNKAPWLTLFKLQKIGTLQVLNRVLERDLNNAYEIWLKMFLLDQSWLHSARSAISHSAAIRAVHQDLLLLSLIRIYSPDQHPEKIIEALQSFDPEKINYRHALISEYLLNLMAADTVIPKALQEKSLWLRVVFNRALFRRELNNRFRRLEALLQDPKAITEETVRPFHEEAIEDLRKNPFWWFYNPAGKIIRNLFSFHYARNILDFYAEKMEIQKIRSQLLAEPLFPPDAPEDREPE